LQHSEVPVTRPKEEEVLIKVEAASLNPIDWRGQEGIPRPILLTKWLSILPVAIPSVNC
jgi:chloroplastic oxoene reductase